MNKIPFALPLLALSIVLTVVTTAAQRPDTDLPGISGLVRDQAGAWVAGAEILLLDPRTGTERRTRTDAGGAFAFGRLRSGQYVLRITAAGFEPKEINFVVPADGADAADDLLIVLEIAPTRVTVTAEVGRRATLENVPQAVSIVGPEAIAERAPAVLAQAGREEAGLNVQRTSPTLGAIVVRGLTGKNVVHYIDGIRYTNAAQRGGINTFFNLNEPTNLQAIEILRGPNAAQYGSDSLGGTVNLITRQPVYGETESEWHGEFSAGANTADRSFGGGATVSYGTGRLGGYVNLAGRRAGTIRPAGGIDTHSALTRFLGLPSTILYKRLPGTGFTQYGGAAHLDYAPAEDRQFVFHYQRSQQDDGQRFDHLLGGNGNLIHDLRNLMLDFGYVRFIRANLPGLDTFSLAVSYNSQREERVRQDGQGDPLAEISHQYERTSVLGVSFFLDRELPGRNSFLLGGDFYHEKINSPAFTVDPATGTARLSRPRIPDEGRFDSGGVFVQNGWNAIPDRLRITGALRYSVAEYTARAADAPIVGGERLWGDDRLRVGDFSGRIGAVTRLGRGLRAVFNYSRGFRYPSMTDLGTLGLTGDGYEVDFAASSRLGGTLGTTAGLDAADTGIPVSEQRSEISHNFDAGLRLQNRRWSAEFTAFRLDLNETIVKQALILPPGAVGRFLGDQPIVRQLPSGVVFVPVSSDPVLVRANYTDARLFGLESALTADLTEAVGFRGNFTFIRAEDKETGEPPSIEGGTPPPTGFLGLRYAPPARRFWIEAFANFAFRQDRLSSLDLRDRRTGATRSRRQIARFFRNGACVYGLTGNPDGVCGTGDENILLPTGETLAEVQNRVLGTADSAPLYTSLPGYFLFNLRGSIAFGDRSRVFIAFENIFDRPFRHPSWGVDGAGRSLLIRYRYVF